MKEAAEKAAKYIKKRKTKAKPTEEKSFAQFAKKCEAEGLLESKPPEEGSSKDEASKAKGSRTASPLPANFNPEANLSNMSKEQADKHQEEMLTWQDRWHQNKKVSTPVLFLENPIVHLFRGHSFFRPPIRSVFYHVIYVQGMLFLVDLPLEG